MSDLDEHFSKNYIYILNELLHQSFSTLFYKFEVYEVKDLAVSILITYDEQEDDEYILYKDVTLDDFNERLKKIKPDLLWEEETLKKFADNPEKTILGWEGRAIYIIKGGKHPEYWNDKTALQDLDLILRGSHAIQGPLILDELRNFHRIIPLGPENFKVYEHMVRVTWNYLFMPILGESKSQQRTEPGNEGLEIRDLICSNNADSGFWKDLKDKYESTEIIIEVKNINDINRDDLRQIYCYLKRAIGFWGFIVCRGAVVSKNINLYNKTLFNNFEQRRGVLILTDRDLNRMVEMKLRGHDPSDYLRGLMSKFLRSI